MPNEIADAFGVSPDSLELVEHEDLNKAEFCQSCKEWAKKNAELEAQLAESRKVAEHYKQQIERLLMTYPRISPLN